MKRAWILCLGMIFCVGIIAARPAALKAQGNAAPPTGLRGDFLADWDDMAKKAVSLAEAMPAEKYTWRPEGARSVAEIYLHIASGNYIFPQMLGIKPPAGIDPRTLERSTPEKAKVVGILKASLEHARQAVLQTPDADLDKPVTMFGQKTTVRGLFYTLGTHQHEHFGLAIAYARINGVVPPWTAERQQRQQQQPAKQPPKQ